MKSPLFLTFFIFIITFTQGDAIHRKCLEDKNCDEDECCAMAFYLFRCEKRGLKDGDSCGLCGCTNPLSCVSEGMFPWRVLSGRGVCRHARRPSHSLQNCTTAAPPTSQQPNQSIIFQNLLPNNRSPPNKLKKALRP